MFLKNRNISSKIKGSKVTDYAALSKVSRLRLDNLFLLLSQVRLVLDYLYKICLLCLWPCSLAITSTGRVGLWFCDFYFQEHPVVLVLKRLRRRGHDKYILAQLM